MSIPTAIILRGTGNCGKTETLNTLIDFIKKDSLFSDVKIESINVDKHGNAKDRMCTARYGEKTIAITTQGDAEIDLKSWINYAGNDHDIYVCPCRTSGSSFHFVEKRFMEYQKIWHGKWYVNNCIEKAETSNMFIVGLREKTNQLQAEAIYELLFSLVSENGNNERGK